VEYALCAGIGGVSIILIEESFHQVGMAKSGHRLREGGGQGTFKVRELTV